MKLIKLLPFITDYIWGGRRLCDVYGIDASQPAAEAWVFSAHPDGQSRTSEGELFGDWLKKNPGALGENAKVSEGFGAPVLCKFIDAEKPLSIQVHPNDAFAGEFENSPGKTELWYIVDASEGAYIYYGLKKNVTEEELRGAMLDGSVTELLNKVYVKKGEAYFVPAGTVHAIGGGLLICEIQQSSNVTYRMWDYGRVGADGKPRALHVEKAAKCTCKNATEARPVQNSVLAECEYFKSVKYCVESGEILALGSGKDSFLSVIAVAGEGVISAEGERSDIAFGDSFVVPANSGEIRLCTNSVLEVIVTSAAEQK